MPHFPSSIPPATTTATTTTSPPTRPDHLSEFEPIRTKNRRKRYLDLHPEYFTNPDLELADPLLYDRLVRRFQTAAEREREGRARGYSRILEADLARSEAKLAALARPCEGSESEVRYARATDGSIVEIEGEEDEGGEEERELLRDDDEDEPMAMGDGEGVQRGGGRRTQREVGWARWTDVMGQRFLRGEDREFEYGAVDGGEEFDDRGEEERERLEEYLRGEEEEFVGVGSPRGETGVQDF